MNTDDIEQLDFQHVVRIKEEAERWLFDLPGVRGVALGPKFVADRAIGKLAIQVFVKSKRPRTELAASEVIPEFIEGIPTDVWEMGQSIDSQQEITVNDGPSAVIQNATAVTTGSTVTHFEITSPSHGLFDKARVLIVGENTLTNVAFPVTVKDDDTFLIPVTENGADQSPLSLPYVANSASWINVCTFDNLCCCPTGPIEFVGTAGDKVTIGSSRHGLLNKDRIKVRKSPLLLQPQIHEVKVVDPNTFELVGANANDFQGSTGTWRWRKVSVAPAGRITRIQMSNPIAIRSVAHGLAKNDRIVIQTINNITNQQLDNHVNRRSGPYRVEIVDANNFILPEVDATGWGSPDLQNDFIGSWIKIIEDFRNYKRKWGGIRLEMKESETETVERTPTSQASSPLTTRPGGQVSGRLEVRLGTGTLGCIAIDLSTGKKVFLSNAHVLFAGTDNDEVHHPDYYACSRTCSKHKIGVRDQNRKLFGEDPAHPGNFVDAAIARIDPDKGEYDPFIADIGAVQGIAEIQSDTELVNGDFRVWKRGAQTGITEGILISVELSLPDAEDGFTWRKQLHIRPIEGPFRGFMSVRGDSGSVVVNKDNKIVGLISKALGGGFATANRIRDVELALGIKIWNVNDPPVAGEDPAEPGQGQVATVGIPVLFAATLAEISASESGAQLAVIVRSHVAEAMNLVETNRKFATIWHRSHGPRLMQHLRQIIEARNQRMPASVEGRSLQELLTAIFDGLRKFGSAQLAAQVNAHEQFILRLLTCTYEEMLQLLKSSPPLAPKT